MVTPDRRTFDRGFALSYPRTRGLDERILNGGRAIVERLPVDGDAMERLWSAGFPLFPVTDIGGVRIHHIPTDARDLTSIIRLSNPVTLETVGSILGRKLVDMVFILEQVPSDVVLPRFAVTNASVSAANVSSGINIMPVPPYDRLNPDTSHSTAHLMGMIEADLLDVRTTESQNEAFLDGVNNGFESA